MGYTHYFEYNTNELDLNTWKKFTKEVKKLLKGVLNLKHSWEYQNKKPVVSTKQVSFNGFDNDALEDFVFDRISSKEFNFVKTNEKPYDLYVCAVLLLAKHFFKDAIDISSDGESKDWLPAYELVKKECDLDISLDIIFEDEELVMIYFIGLPAKNGYYISLDSNKNKSDYYDKHYYTFSKLLFDKNIPEKTYHAGWYCLPKKPNTVELVPNKQEINHRFILKNPDQFPTLQKQYMKNEVVLNHDEDYETDFDLKEAFEQYSSLYKYTYDFVQPDNIIVNFSIRELDAVDYDLNINTKYRDIQHSLITNITQPEIAKVAFPCKLSHELSYRIIREYVKLNINNKHAYIESDYDFCFQVRKKIELNKEEEYTIDVNRFSFKKRKPKLEKRYRKERDMTIFKMSPRNYEHYPLCVQFEGNNYNDLEKNIQEYLNNLMDEINKPVKDCPHCNGAGVVF